jgi:hypothetical protein
MDIPWIHGVPRTRETVVNGERDVPVPRKERPPVPIRRTGTVFPGTAVDQQQGWVGTGRGRRVQVAEQGHTIVVGILDPRLNIDVHVGHVTSSQLQLVSAHW